MKVKVFLGHIMTALFAFFASFIAGNFFSNGTSGFDANTLCSLTASVGIIFGIVSFFAPNRSNKDAIISGIIYIVLGLAIGGLTAGQQQTYAIVVAAILLIAFGFNKVFYYLGYLKGGIERRSKTRPLGLSNVLICIGLIAEAIIIVLVQFKVLDIVNIGWAKYLFTILLSVLGAFTLIYATYYVIRFKFVTNKSNNKVRTQSNTTSTQKDYRSVDRSSISSILYDRCYDIARHHSGSYDITKGSVSLDITVKINNGNINYTINGSLNPSDVKDNYDANDFKSSLKNLLENKSNQILNETDSTIDKLRKQYQNYDGEYNMHVDVGTLK